MDNFDPEELAAIDEFLESDSDEEEISTTKANMVYVISQDIKEDDEDIINEFNRKHAWFIAFAPADAPEIALSVLVENGGGGSSVAAPIAREVIDAYLLPQLAAR